MNLQITKSFPKFKFTQFAAVFTVSIFFGYVALDLAYNTAFVDEAIYATVGEEVLRGIFWENAISWMAGSYLYPVASAIVNRYLGLTGVRFMSLIFVTVVGIVAGKSSFKLGKTKAFVFTLLMFFTTAIAMDLAQFGTYDAPALFFLSLSLFFGLNFDKNSPIKNSVFVVISAAFFALSVLSKYITIIFLPIGFLVVFYRKRLGLAESIIWVAVVQLILGFYVISNVDALQAFVASEAFSQPIGRIEIVKDIFRHLNIHIFGAAAALIFSIKHSNKKRYLVLVLFLGGAMPLAYHLYSANIRSIWKHLVFTLFFWAPLTGWSLSVLTDWFNRNVKTDIIAKNLYNLIFIFLGVLLTSNLWTNLSRHWVFQRSWPSVSPSLDFLEKNRQPGNKIFAEASAVYKYHLFDGFEDPASWSSTWYFQYGELFGEEAMKTAIADKYFDYVILNGYFTEYINIALVPVLEQNYFVVSEDVYKLSGKYDSRTRVWAPKEN